MREEPTVWINYPAYQNATQHLTLDQRGLLFQLQLRQYSAKGLPKDPELMRRRVRCRKDAWNRDWPAIRCFLEPGGAPWLRESEDMPEDDLGEKA